MATKGKTHMANTADQAKVLAAGRKNIPAVIMIQANCRGFLDRKHYGRKPNSLIARHEPSELE